jgi:hypothetical protein
MEVMKKSGKIKWKYRNSQNVWEGKVEDRVRFCIEGLLCVTDLGEVSEQYVQPKHYRISSVEEGKTIASDLLNGLNLTTHFENCKEWEDRGKKTADLIEEARAFLASLDKECTCERPGDNTCDYCEEQESKRILDKARKDANKQTIDSAAEDFLKIGKFQDQESAIRHSFIHGALSDAAKNYWFEKFKDGQ